MAKAAGARCCMRGAARTMCWRSASPRRARITSSPSTAARSWRPASTARSQAAWAIAETLEATRQAARHPGDRDRQRARRRRARLRSAQRRAHDRAGAASPRSTSSRASRGTANWSRSARRRSLHDRPRRRAAAARRLPAGDRRRRSGAGAAGRPSMPARPSTSPTCSAGIGTFRAAARRTRARHGRRQRRRARSRRWSRRPQTTSGLKPIEAQARDLFRRPFIADELKRFDAVVFDPPRQGAEAQARELAKSKVPDRRRGVVRCDHLRARRQDPDRRRLPARCSVTPVDQFRYSASCRVVAKFERR